MATTPVPAPSGARLQPAADPWATLRGEVDRLFDRFGFGFAPSFASLIPGGTSTALYPATELAEDETSYRLSIELPGMTEKDVQVSISNGVLTLKGEKRQETDRTEKDVHFSERSYGAFQRSYTLPEGMNRDEIKARFADGVLTVTLPKLAQSAAQTIEVTRG